MKTMLSFNCNVFPMYYITSKEWEAAEMLVKGQETASQTTSLKQLQEFKAKAR